MKRTSDIQLRNNFTKHKRHKETNNSMFLIVKTVLTDQKTYFVNLYAKYESL